MNVKALLVFVAVLIVVSFATESEAFMGGGGMIGKIQSKREYKVSLKIMYFSSAKVSGVRTEARIHIFHCY